MKQLISLRMTIKDITGVTLCQMNTYGIMDGRTIIAERRTFRAGRKAGFGKSAYIYERANGDFHKVIIDRMQEV